MKCLASGGLATTSTPLTSALPDVGMTLVVSMPTVVVLPAPLGPSRPKISPRITDRSRRSTAVSPPGYTLVSCVVLMTSTCAVWDAAGAVSTWLAMRGSSTASGFVGTIEDALEHRASTPGDPPVLVAQIPRCVIEAAGQPPEQVGGGGQGVAWRTLHEEQP